MNKDKLHFLSPLFLKYQSEFEKNPRSRVFAPLAESYRKVGMTDKALEILSQGIRFNPSYVMGYLGLASCYFDMKQFGLAYSTLRPLVETNRDNIRLQKLFSDICISYEHKEEALETLKYLLFINPKDKEVAKLVSILESEIEEKYKPNHRPIIIPAENFEEDSVGSNLFDIEKLTSSPKVDFDDWLNIDLSNKVNEKEQTKKNEFINSDWKVEKQIHIPVKPVESEEEITEVKFNLEPEPLVTHTLVDLYCGQGHIEKAIEVLEKILLLNPNDLKTKEKLLEIQSLISPIETEFEETKINDTDQNTELSLNNVLNLTEHNPKLVDLVELENVTEEDGRRNLMSILDETILSNDLEIEEIEDIENSKENRNYLIEKKLTVFLQKIQERALDYQRRF